MFAGSARAAVFSKREVAQRINADFAPVALKAAQVNNPPAGDEGRFYREIGRSKAAPQGICVVNSAGKVLAWSLMFDDDAAVVGFLDYALQRYAAYPGAEKPFPAERFMKYPSQKMSDVEDSGQGLPVLAKHREDERCLGATRFPEGTLAGRAYGRAFKDGKPLGDTTQQEHYIEDRFEAPVEAQESLARDLAAAGDRPFALPESLVRALVSTAYLGMLDVDPLGAPGGRNDRKSWEFRGWKDGSRVRIEGSSHVTGGESRAGAGSDGRRWSHEVKLAWKGFIEMKENRISRLLAVAEGSEKLKWGNERMIREGRSEVAHLPEGRPIDFDGEVRYGFEARPVAGREIGSGPEHGLPDKMKKFQAALQLAQQEGRDLSEVGKALEGLESLMREGKRQEAEERIDRALKLLGGDVAPASDAPESFRAKLRQLHEAIHGLDRKRQEVQGELQQLQPLLQKGDFAAAEKQIDKIVELIRKP